MGGDSKRVEPNHTVDLKDPPSPPCLDQGLVGLFSCGWQPFSHSEFFVVVLYHLSI